MHNKPRIVFLYTPTEGRYAKSVSSAILNCGGKPVIFDYLASSIDLEEIDEEVLRNTLTQDSGLNIVHTVNGIMHDEVSRTHFINELRQKSNVILEQKMEQWLKEHNISGILLPGDKFNYDCEPSHSEPKIRPRFSKVLLNIAKRRGMPLVGVCGGLQAVAAAEGITLSRVADILDKSGQNKEQANLHILSEKYSDIDPNFISRNARRENLVSGTNLQKIVGNGTILIPEAHGGAIDHTDAESMIRMHQLGYKIAARSPDGIIQAIEMISGKNHITLFQGHPEALACIGMVSGLDILKGVLIDPAIEYMTHKSKNSQPTGKKNDGMSFVEQLVASSETSEKSASHAIH